MKRFLAQAKTLFPAYFAYVMATEIVASALDAFGFTAAAITLFFAGLAGYLTIWLLTIIRIVKYRKDFYRDFASFTVGPGFFTIIASTGVLGSATERLFGLTSIAFALYCLAIALWIILSYGFATMVIVTSEKPEMERGVSGSWLVIAVATQSLAVLGTYLIDRVPFFLTCSFFMLGSASYLILISLIVSRLVLTKVEAAYLAPPYWIMMGAAAISCLAGTLVHVHASEWTYSINPIPVLEAFTLFFWIVATAWIPLLIIMGFWRHGVKKVALTYEPQLWGMVFPLGMYTLATLTMSRQFDFPFLKPIANWFLPIACLAWLLTFGGMFRKFFKNPSTVDQHQD